MDPATIVRFVEGFIKLAVQCGSAAESLNSLVGLYKYVKLAISSMVQRLGGTIISSERLRDLEGNIDC